MKSLARFVLDKGFGLSNRFVGIISPERARMRGVIRVTKQYNMAAEKNEDFFARLYLHHIRERIERVFGKRRITILDVGCGQGRIALPLAREGHGVTGIDVSEQAIESGKRSADQQNVPITFLSGNIETDLRRLQGRSFDCVVCTEVLYMVKNCENTVKDLVGLIRDQGLVILSFRPRLFYVLLYAMKNNMETAESLAMNDDRYFNKGLLNCHNKDQIEDLFRESGLTDMELRGIGVLSGIEGDPQAQFIIPAKHDKKEWDRLIRMETKLSGQFVENSRYILASGIKRVSAEEGSVQEVKSL